MRVYRQILDLDLRVVSEGYMDVDDPTPAEVALTSARGVDGDRLAAITEALAESGDAKLVAVADSIVAKGGVPRRPPEEPKPGLVRRAVSAVTGFFTGRG